MKRFERLSLLVLVFVLSILWITGCSKEATRLEFSFTHSEKTAFEDKKSFFFSAEKDLITIDSIIHSDSEYILSVQAEETTKNNLVMTSDDKLVKEVIKPSVEIRDTHHTS